MPRALLIVAVVLLSACGPRVSDQQITDEERRIMASLMRDPYVEIERTERDADGNLLVLTSQGRITRRYLIAADDPARPVLRLRLLRDECTLDTADNPNPGGGAERRGL